MKTIKIIDLLNKIANGEEAPRLIRINGCNFRFSSYVSIDCYYTEERSNKFWLSFMNIDLTDEVEILDEENEFEDIETITSVENKAEELVRLADTINQLIKNQKKILERLKEE